ncbi:MAG: GNAT family N-acetyltransferase [Burkholderiales bacterium]
MDDIPDFKISPADISDVPLILSLVRELAEYERLSHMVVATEDMLRRQLFGAQACAQVVIARENNQPVGFALYFWNFSTFLGKPGLYLEDVFVRPPFRGKGYGKALLLHLAGLAKKRGCGRFEWSVLDWNEPAIKFYESLGAVGMHQWKLYRVTGDALDKLATQADCELLP